MEEPGKILDAYEAPTVEEIGTLHDLTLLAKEFNLTDPLGVTVGGVPIGNNS